MRKRNLLKENWKPISINNSENEEYFFFRSKLLGTFYFSYIIEISSNCNIRSEEKKKHTPTSYIGCMFKYICMSIIRMHVYEYIKK